MQAKNVAAEATADKQQQPKRGLQQQPVAKTTGTVSRFAPTSGKQQQKPVVTKPEGPRKMEDITNKRCGALSVTLFMCARLLLAPPHRT